MKARLFVVTILLLVTASAFAGYGHLGQAAGDLEYAAKSYAEKVHYYSNSSKLNRSARRFASAASDFCYLVANGADFYAIEKSYAHLQNRYYKLQRRASHGYRKAPRLNRVSYAFSKVDHALQYQLSNNQRYYDKKRYGYERGYRRNNRDRLAFRLSFGHRY